MTHPRQQIGASHTGRPAPGGWLPSRAWEKSLGTRAAVAARAAGREENPKRVWVRRRPVRLHTALPAPQPWPGVSEQPEDTTLQLARGLKSFISLSLTFRSGKQGSGVNCFCCKCQPRDLHVSAALAGGEGARGPPHRGCRG